jgi:hypothetical protein
LHGGSLKVSKEEAGNFVIPVVQEKIFQEELSAFFKLHPTGQLNR